MAVRVKRHWYQESRPRTPEEQASVVAVAVWKSARHGLQGLRQARFEIDVGAPYLGILDEFLVFLVTVADRFAYRQGGAMGGDDGDGWRSRFTVALARRVAGLYQDNLDELIGPAAEPSGHAGRLIGLLNARMAEYADFTYGDDGPEFAFLRYFGRCIEAVLPSTGDRKWVLDQVMATQAPEALETIERTMRGVFGLDPKPNRRPHGE